MSMIFFTFRAQTGARKGVMILGGAGIQGFVARTPGFLSTGGCGYGIRVAAKDGRRRSFGPGAIPMNAAFGWMGTGGGRWSCDLSGQWGHLSAKTQKRGARDGLGAESPAISGTRQ